MGLRRILKDVVSTAARAAIRDELGRFMGGQESGQAKGNYPSANYLGADRLLCRTKYGHKLFMVASDVSLTPHVAMDGYWEEWITNIFREAIKPGMRVADVGANVGYYSVLAADLVGDQGEVVSFEANRELSDIVFRNLQINGYQARSNVIGKAVYSIETTLNFSIYKEHKGSSGLWASSEDAAKFRDEVEVVQVPAISLDSFYKDKPAPDFVKIDAEGSEGHVIAGMRGILERNKNTQLLVEYNPDFIAGGFGSLAEFHQMITAMGFSPYLAGHDSRLKKMTFDELNQAGIQHCDILLRRG